MDWRAIQFDWNRARAFLVTAEEGSLTAAARAMGVSQPTLGRQVTELEKELGVALFERKGKGLELTPSGQELLSHVRNMGHAATSLSLMATGKSDSLAGDICITASEVMAALMLPRLVKKLHKIEPSIRIELIASNQASDLKRREADIAIRLFRPTEPDLIIKKLRDVLGNLYASKSYLKELGYPKTITDLNKATFIGFDKTDRYIELLKERGLNLTSANIPVFSADRITQWELCKQGVGIAIMQEDVGDFEPLVQRVLPDFEPYTGIMWLVSHRELKTNRRVRRVFDFLASELR